METSKGSGPSIHLTKPKGRIFREGNVWCATGPEFIDPVVSPFGSGDTPEAAHEGWCERAARDPAWKHRVIPDIDDFEIEVSLSKPSPG